MSDLFEQQSALYRSAIEANLAVIEWANQNGKHLIYSAGNNQVNPNASTDTPNTFNQALDDYGYGVSQLNGPETILSFKVASDQTTYNNMNEGYNFSNYVYVGERAQRGVLTNFVKLYRDQAGNDIEWPAPGVVFPTDRNGDQPVDDGYEDMETFQQKIEKMELPEDEEKGMMKDVQDLVNEYNKDIDNIYKDKEKELMTV